MRRALALAAALCALTPSLAQAQIYAWRDANGRMVLSDKPKSPNAKTYAVSYTTADAEFRVTRPLARPANSYQALIDENARANDLSPDFVRAVVQAESGFNARARSVKGALGLMQLMPDTAAEYGVRNAFDPAENIRAGTSYLKALLTRYNNNATLALAAYNAGPGAVDKYGRTVPPYRETRAYVARIERQTNGAARQPASRIYKTVQVVNGRPIVHFTDKPTPGAEVVRAAERK